MAFVTSGSPAVLPRIGHVMFLEFFRAPFLQTNAARLCLSASVACVAESRGRGELPRVFLGLAARSTRVALGASAHVCNAMGQVCTLWEGSAVFVILHTVHSYASSAGLHFKHKINSPMLSCTSWCLVLSGNSLRSFFFRHCWQSMYSNSFRNSHCRHHVVTASTLVKWFFDFKVSHLPQ